MSYWKCDKCPGRVFSHAGWLAHQILEHHEELPDYEVRVYAKTLWEYESNPVLVEEQRPNPAQQK